MKPSSEPRKSAGGGSEMNQEELNEIIRLHGLWLIGPGGVRADLRGANLQGASLQDVDLRGAVLKEANLRVADLRGVNLLGANLENADLSDAGLQDTNLRDARLLGANLSGTFLRNANLRNANLRGANLQGATLRDADLRDAVLEGANLQEARLRDTLLDCANGAEHYSIGWHGHGEHGRTLRAVCVNRELVFFCGCFSGTEADLREFIEQDHPELAPSRLRALEIILELHEETK